MSKNLSRSAQIVIWLAIGLAFVAHQVHAAPKKIVVKVRLIDARSGKPLRHISVGMRFWRADVGIANPPSEASGKRTEEMIPPVGSILPETDARGVVSFEVPEHSLPLHVSFGPFAPPNLWGCSAYSFPLDQILQTGVVAAYDVKRCGKLKSKTVSASPGEVVIYDRVISQWDWLRQELP